uniref:Uncharacterized protein n=1 Tax=Palpitomonas bilix TaxID=652834 RepID=A0A7S3LT43_9EUKA
MERGSRASPSASPAPASAIEDGANPQQQVIVSLGELKSLEDEVIALRSNNQTLERSLEAEQKNSGNLAEFIDTLIALNAKQKEGLVERLESARRELSKTKIWHSLSVSLAVKTMSRQIALIQLLRGILRRHMAAWKLWLVRRKRAKSFARRCLERRHVRNVRSCFESWKAFAPESRGKRMRSKLEKQTEKLEGALRDKERNLLKLKEETAEDLRSLQLEDERQQQDLREEVERLEGKLFEVEGVINDKEKEILDLRKERKKFILSTAQLDNEIASLKGKMEEMQKEKGETEARMEAVKEDSDERSSYIKNLEREVNDARVREIALKRRLRELERKDQDVTALGLYIDKVEGIPGLQKEAKEMKRRAVTLELEVDRHKKEVEALTVRADAAERKAERRSVRIDSLMKEKEEVETEYARIERELKKKDDALQEMEKDREYFKYRVDEVRQELDITLAKVDRLERDLDTEKQRANFFQGELLEKDKGLAAIVREACAGRDSELERKDIMVKEMKYDIEEKDRAIARLELDVDDLAEKKKMLEKENNVLREGFDQLKMELDRKRREVEEERDRQRRGMAAGSMTVKKILQGEGREDGIELPSVRREEDREEVRLDPSRTSSLDLPLPPLASPLTTSKSRREEGGEREKNDEDRQSSMRSSKKMASMPTRPSVTDETPTQSPRHRRMKTTPNNKGTDR